jgi:hypothetical protein
MLSKESIFSKALASRPKLT